MFLISIGKLCREARTQEQPDSNKPEYKREEEAHFILALIMASALFSSAPVNSIVKGFFRAVEVTHIIACKICDHCARQRHLPPDDTGKGIQCYMYWYVHMSTQH